MILASGDVGIMVWMQLCQNILIGNRMPAALATCVAIPNSKERGYTMNCGMHRGEKLLELATKIGEKVLEERLSEVTIDDIQFGFMPGRRTIGAVFISRGLQEYLAKQKKLCMCFVDPQKALDVASRKVVE